MTREDAKLQFFPEEFDATDWNFFFIDGVQDVTEVGNTVTKSCYINPSVLENMTLVAVSEKGDCTFNNAIKL